MGISGLQPYTPQWLALASLSALIAAVFLLLARIVRLGFLANFISRTVLIGFLTGVGIQVAMGQLSGMLGVPEPHVSRTRSAAPLIKFWDTLSELGQTSGATLAVSLTVIAVLVVFGRWIKAVPGGLVAVVGAIVVSYAFSLSSHGVTILGPVPRGLPHLGAAQRHLVERRAQARRHVRVDVPRHPRPERRHQPRLRRQVPRAAGRERRPGRPGNGKRGGRSQQHLRRQRKPDQDRDGRRGQEPHAGRPADDRRGRCDRPAVPDQAPAVPPQRSALGRRVRDRREADRRQAHAPDLRPAEGRVHGRGADRRGRRLRRRRAGHHPRDRALDRAPRPPPLPAAQHGGHA